MNTDFRITTDALDHPKLVKLKRIIGDAGVICLMRLWGFTARYHPKGELNDMTPEDIEIAAKWDGGPGDFFDALIKLRLLDECLGQYSVHDWAEHNAYCYHAPERTDRARKAANARWSDPHASSNAPSNADRNAPSPNPNPSPSPNPSTPIELEFDVALVDFVIEILPGKKSDSNLRKQVDALDKLIRLDREKVAPDMPADVWEKEVFAVLTAMRADTEPRGDFPGWSTVFNSIPRLRANDCEKYRNARAWYLTQRKKGYRDPQTDEARIRVLASQIKITEGRLEHDDPEGTGEVQTRMNLKNMKHELGKLEGRNA